MKFFSLGVEDPRNIVSIKTGLHRRIHTDIYIMVGQIVLLFLRMNRLMGIKKSKSPMSPMH